MKRHLPYLSVIVVLLLVIGINRCSNNTTTTITERTTIDSTKVDSLTKRISYLESLPPETTTVEIKVPSTPDTVYQDNSGETIREFTSMHTDSVITATWRTGVQGYLKYQDFSYSLHHRPVVRETVTKFVTQYRTTERTITKHAGGFLAIGGSIGVSQIGIPYEAEIRYQAKDGYSYHGKYTKLPTGDDAIMVGLTIPLRLRLPF